MKTFKLFPLAILLVLGSALAVISCNDKDDPVSPVQDPPNIDPLIYNPFEHLFGLTYPQWIDAWLKNVPANSCSNTAGDNLFATLDASGRVYFLAGANGEAVTRDITIDDNKYIFFPIVNNVTTYPCTLNGDQRPDPGQTMEGFLKQQSAKFIENVTSLKVTIDGLPYRTPYLHHYVTPSFQIFNNRMLGNCFDACIEQDKTQDAVSDGYWIMLKPLSGDHVLNFKAEVKGYGVVTDVTYNIIAR